MIEQEMRIAYAVACKDEEVLRSSDEALLDVYVEIQQASLKVRLIEWLIVSRIGVWGS